MRLYIIKQMEKANNIWPSDGNIIAMVQSMVEEKMSSFEMMLKAALSSKTD